MIHILPISNTYQNPIRVYTLIEDNHGHAVLRIIRLKSIKPWFSTKTFNTTNYQNQLIVGLLYTLRESEWAD